MVTILSLGFSLLHELFFVDAECNLLHDSTRLAQTEDRTKGKKRIVGVGAGLLSLGEKGTSFGLVR